MDEQKIVIFPHQYSINIQNLCVDKGRNDITAIEEEIHQREGQDNSNIN